MIYYNLKAETVKYHTNLFHQSEMCDISGYLMNPALKMSIHFLLELSITVGKAMRNGQLHAKMQIKTVCLPYQNCMLNK